MKTDAVIVSAGKAEVPKPAGLPEPKMQTQEEGAMLPASPPLPPAGSPPSVRKPEPVKGSKFVLNFDNADLYEVIRVMAEMMNINYIVDPRVKGIVNIRTTGQISTQDIFPILQAILNMNGAAAVKKGII
jgi:type II secretory pathway component GspD/PulD (secretin)